MAPGAAKGAVRPETSVQVWGGLWVVRQAGLRRAAAVSHTRRDELSGKARRVSESTIDADAVRARLDTALATAAPGFETFFLARLLDLSFVYLPEGAAGADVEACRVSFPVAPFLGNPQGTLHGGIIATVMDISMGHLLNKATGLSGTATIEMKTQYMRPVGPGVAVAEGRFLRRGRTMAFMESRLTDASAKLCAHATATWKLPG